MAQGKATKSKGGRAKAKMARRLANRVTQKHKVIRIFKSCGLKEAEKYGVQHIVLTHLREYQEKHRVRKRGEHVRSQDHHSDMR